ncbi:MAG TPA: DUF3054 domain-containing protein [Chloroflexota bacterium]|nr:DUF3054 domain-containing protein [Chloroflexota bacterium]
MKSRTAAWTGIAALGDVLILILFAAIGRLSHHRSMASPVEDVLVTALPFLAGWAAGAGLGGGYSAVIWTRRRVMLSRTARSWITGGLIALVIRSFLERRVVPLSFAAVVLTFNLVLLSAWRLALGIIRSRVEP